jgi:TP901 family phage tail tape measure protein
VASDLTVGRVLVELYADTSAFSSRLNTATKKLKKFGQDARRVGQAMSLYVTAPLVAAGGFAVKTAVEFDSSMTKIQTLVGIAGDEVDAFRKRVKAMSADVGKGPKELAEALFFITSAGLRGERALKALEFAAKGSAIGLGETKVVADALTSAMNAFAKQGLTAERATDVLTLTVREGKVEADQLAGAVGKVLPIVAEVGGTFEDAGAFIATFTRVGADANIAATSLRGALTLLFKSGKDGEAALRATGRSLAEFRAEIVEKGLAGALVDLIEDFGRLNIDVAKFIPNARALSGVLAAASSQGQTYVEIMDRMRNATNVTEKAFSVWSETAEAAFAKATASFEKVRLEFGEKFLPSAVTLIETVGAIVKVFGALPGPVKGAGAALLGFLAIIGPVTWAVGALAGGIAGLVKVFGVLGGVLHAIGTAWVGLLFLSPGGALAVGLIAVAAAAYGAVRAFQALRDAFDDTAEKAAEFAESQRNLVGTMKDARSAIRRFNVAMDSETRTTFENAKSHYVYLIQHVIPGVTKAYVAAKDRVAEFNAEIEKGRAWAAYPVLEWLFKPEFDTEGFEKAKAQVLKVESVLNELGLTLSRTSQDWDAPFIPPPETEEAKRKVAEAVQAMRDTLRELDNEIAILEGRKVAFDIETEDMIRDLEPLRKELEKAGHSFEEFVEKIKAARDRTKKLEFDRVVTEQLEDIQAQVDAFDMSPIERQTDRMLRDLRRQRDELKITAEQYEKSAGQIVAAMQKLEDKQSEIRFKVGGAVADAMDEMLVGILRGTQDIHEAFDNALDNLVVAVWKQAMQAMVLDKIREFDIPVEKNFVDLAKDLANVIGGIFDKTPFPVPGIRTPETERIKKDRLERIRKENEAREQKLEGIKALGQVIDEKIRRTGKIPGGTTLPEERGKFPPPPDVARAAGAMPAGRGVLGVPQQVVDALADIQVDEKSIAEKIVEKIRAVIDAIDFSGVFDSLLEKLDGLREKLWTKVRDVGTEMLGALDALKKGVVSVVKEVWNVLEWAFRGIGDVVAMGAEAAKEWTIGELKQIWGAVESLNKWNESRAEEAARAKYNPYNALTFLGTGGSVGGSSGGMSDTAAGGITTGPSIRRVGEAGREAIVPLDRAPEFGFGFAPGVDEIGAEVQGVFEALGRNAPRATIRAAPDLGGSIEVVRAVEGLEARLGAAIEGLSRGPERKIAVKALAAGGIATGPTLAMIGEGRRKEAVIPLDRIGGGGTTVIVNVHNETDDQVDVAEGVGPDNETVLDIMISRSLERDVRKGGPMSQLLTERFDIQRSPIKR